MERRRCLGKAIDGLGVGERGEGAAEPVEQPPSVFVARDLERAPIEPCSSRVCVECEGAISALPSARAARVARSPSGSE
jgi:hypothetical protein